MSLFCISIDSQHTQTVELVNPCPTSDVLLPRSRTTWSAKTSGSSSAGSPIQLDAIPFLAQSGAEVLTRRCDLFLARVGLRLSASSLECCVLKVRRRACFCEGLQGGGRQEYGSTESRRATGLNCKPRYLAREQEIVAPAPACRLPHAAYRL
eukprot:763990-Hanusia_phi.AAC.1